MPRRSPASDQTPSGFSLIELLVVIALIALLLALMMPALKQARESSVRVQCQNSVRQIMMATLGYAGENRGCLPYPNWANMASGYMGAGWLYLPGQTFTATTEQTGVLWPWLKNAGLYKCQLDQGPFLPGSVHLMTSYIMNGAVCAFGRLAPQPAFKVSQLRPDAVIFFEADESRSSDWNDGANFPSEGGTVRHNRGSCVGILDGHGEWLNAKAYANENAMSPGPMWCCPTTANGH